MINTSTASAMADILPANATDPAAFLPPLPSYTLTPAPDLVRWVPDSISSVLIPIIVYWVLSGFFHVIDTFDLLPAYRLHTPEEITSRNHATRIEVARDVIIQQIIQIGSGSLLNLLDPVAMVGKEDYDVAVWARRVRVAQRAVPYLLGLFGINAASISQSVSADHPLIAGALAGGYYPLLTTAMADGTGAVVPTFATWELMVAKALYWVIVPVLQYLVAIVFLDTWQYFLHRLMHVNRWMYVHFHSRHHRLYVPYAYGALYNHPFEGFLLDTLGAGTAYMLTGMTPRQGILFFSISTVKTVDDHCGYQLPWDPLQLISSNNAAYHDIHHQTWGIKTNFSQPFFTFWDRLLDTQYKGPKRNGPPASRDVKVEKKAQ
jgi:sphinganine C4-monooxygenase